MFFNVLFGIVYGLAILVAFAGCLGIYNLFLSLTDLRLGILGHIGVWIASAAVLAGLIQIAASNEWGPFDPNSCSRSRPCVRIVGVQQ
jgi:hypothetical protein